MKLTLEIDKNVDRCLIRVSNEDNIHPYLDIIEKLSEMDEWCMTNECGWRESSYSFGFESEEAMTMFILRWA